MAQANPHYREAAESLLSSVNSPPYRTFSSPYLNLVSDIMQDDQERTSDTTRRRRVPYTKAHSQSVNLVSEDLVAGHRPNGQMSTVRRFFCLFVTFDLLFTSLIWLICVMMKGETLEQIFEREILHYNIKISLFDIVMVAIIRFTVLLLFYALLYINNWSVISLSTGGTCAFMIAKVFVFDWPNAAQPVYEVFLIMTSFVLAWGEAWFLDFRVLPQELQAKHILESIVQHSASERTPLIPQQSHAHAHSYTESTVKWFSPVETPESSPRPHRPLVLTQEQIEEYKSLAHESMMNSWRVVNLREWTVEKKGTQKGDIVESRQSEFGKVYRFTGTVECPPKFLYEEFKMNITKMPEWNPTILKIDLIKDIGDGVDLSYQVTAGGGRGIIAPRDFVILRKSAQLSQSGQVVEENPHSYINCGVSVTVPGYPPVKEMVRGHNKVGCWYLKPKVVTLSGGKIEHHTTFQWLMCCDLKGKIPQFVLDAAFATVMLDYIKHVRKFIAEGKAAGKF